MKDTSNAIDGSEWFSIGINEERGLFLEGRIMFEIEGDGFKEGGVFNLGDLLPVSFGCFIAIEDELGGDKFRANDEIVGILREGRDGLGFLELDDFHLEVILITAGWKGSI